MILTSDVNSAFNEPMHSSDHTKIYDPSLYRKIVIGITSFVVTVDPGCVACWSMPDLFDRSASRYAEPRSPNVIYDCCVQRSVYTQMHTHAHIQTLNQRKQLQ